MNRKILIIPSPYSKVGEVYNSNEFIEFNLRLELRIKNLSCFKPKYLRDKNRIIAIVGESYFVSRLEAFIIMKELTDARNDFLS